MQKFGWLLLSLLAALSWSIGGILLKPAYKKLSTSQIFLLNGISFLAIWVIYKLLTLSVLLFPNNIFLLLPIIPPLAFITFIFALKKGKVSIVSSVCSASILISTTLSILFFKEIINIIQIISTVVIVFSLIFLGLTEKRTEKGRNFNGFVWGLIAAFSFGISNTVSKFTLSHLGPLNFSIINGSWMILLGIIWLALDKKIGFDKFAALKTQEGKNGVIGSIIYSFGGFFLFLALEKGAISLVIPVTNLSTPITMILAVYFLGEKVTPLQKILIGLIFLATTMLTFL